jgi:hypothetical protein
MRSVAAIPRVKLSGGGFFVDTLSPELVIENCISAVGSLICLQNQNSVSKNFPHSFNRTGKCHLR